MYFLAQEINDVFEDILFAEEKIISESYEEGFSIGAAQGNTEAYHLGYHRGAEVGAKLGFYIAVLESCVKHVQSQSKDYIEKVKPLVDLIEVIQDFPKRNVEDLDILELMNNISAKFKKICVLFKINIKYPHTDKLSF